MSDDDKKQALVVVDDGPNAIFLDSGKFAQAQRAATLFASSSFVPDAFRNNVPNCMIALNMACRLGIDPFMVFQNMYVISGKPGLQANLVIAMINRQGPFDGPVEFEYKGSGNSLSCTAFGILKGSGRRCEATIDWRLVEAEGWNKKPGSKWKTMPEQMMAYRSATFLARRYCPEVLMGLYTTDELVDIKTQENPPQPAKADIVLAKLQKEPKKEEQKEKPKDKPEELKPEEKKGPAPIAELVKDVFPEAKVVKEDKRLEEIMLEARKAGVASKILDGLISDCGMSKKDKSSQTDEKLKDFQAAVSRLM